MILSKRDRRGHRIRVPGVLSSYQLDIINKSLKTYTTIDVNVNYIGFMSPNVENSDGPKEIVDARSSSSTFSQTSVSTFLKICKPI